MAGFVLVHGAFAGGWIWELLRKQLVSAGHTENMPDLPGSGDDHTSPSKVTLDSCAARVCQSLQTSSEPSLLVGNSMGGLIATQAAARCPDRVAALVYVAAFAPQDGQSLLDLTRLPEGAGDKRKGCVGTLTRFRNCRRTRLALNYWKATGEHHYRRRSS